MTMVKCFMGHAFVHATFHLVFWTEEYYGTYLYLSSYSYHRGRLKAVAQRNTMTDCTTPELKMLKKQPPLPPIVLISRYLKLKFFSAMVGPKKIYRLGKILEKPEKVVSV